MTANTSFNPRTRVGCDAFLRGTSIYAKRFNPRTRVGCDMDVYEMAVMTPVSIHAPVWGATSTITPEQRAKWFQSTHPCGVRLSHLIDFRRYLKFQSTHPCGVRRMSFFVGGINIGFNPRTRVGCDNQPQRTQTGERFQSTHPCGVRPPYLAMDRVK